MLENRSPVVHDQYELLNILDSKASALLTFNAIALAAISIWLGYVPLNFMHLCLDLIFIMLLVSCAWLLHIIWLRWAVDDEDEDSLDRVRKARTRDYRRAWRLAVGGVAFLIAVSTVHTLGTALVATNHCGRGCQAFYSEQVFGNLDYGSQQR